MHRPAPSSSLTTSTAFAVAAALENPYSAYSSHYAQAYQHQSTTLDGYTISSAYTPLNSSSFNSGKRGATEPNNHQRTNNPQSSAPWYHPGSNRCSNPGCNFTGSFKALETHKMDRHLIYPPGWEMRKKTSDWDADPSLKGKPVPIQGTTLVLDSPEALDAWISERKRRWPTARRIEDKKQKMDEAIARGQLSPEDASSYGGKRRKLGGPPVQNKGGVRERDSSGNPARRSIPNRRGGEGWNERKPSPEASQAPSTSTNNADLISPSSEVEVDDDKPDVISSKQKPPTVEVPPHLNHKPNVHSSGAPGNSRQIQKRYILQPRREPPNPFASRPALLRNLLLPEIRVTISNLSQAIRFLVDNDFLRNVEMKVGEAEDDMIKVIYGSGEMTS